MHAESSPFKAIAWMVGALVSFAVMAISVRELTGEMHALPMLFIRIRQVSPDAVLAVLASTHYDPKRSIRSWQEYLEAIGRCDARE